MEATSRHRNHDRTRAPFLTWVVVQIITDPDEGASIGGGFAITIALALGTIAALAYIAIGLARFQHGKGWFFRESKVSKMRKVVIAFALIGAVVSLGASTWIAVTPGLNRWLGEDPMLGEFLLSIAGPACIVVAVVAWRWRR